jgi:predicted MFS family arabinose efflux permease
MAASLNTLLFFPEAFAVLVLGRTYSVAKSSLVARLVDDEHRLVASNAQLARLGTVGGVLGGTVGALLVALSSPVASAAAAAIAHAGALVVAWRLPGGPSRRRQASGLEEAELHQARLMLSAVAMAVLRSSVGFVTFFVALVLKTSAEPAWVYGVALLAGGLGGFAGTVVAGPLRRHLEEQSMLVSSLGAVGLVSFVAISLPPRVAVSVLAATVALAATAGRQAFDSLTQRLAPDAEKGRAFAGFEMRFELAWVGGAIIAVAFEPSLPVGLVVIGGGVLAAGLVYAFRLRQQRVPQLVVPFESWGDGDQLAAAVVAMARAMAAQGADRMAIVLAHEAAQLGGLEAGAASADQVVELGRLWRQAASSDPLEAGAAEQAIDLAARIMASSRPGQSR